VEELAHEVEKSDKRKYTICFRPVRIHGGAKCWFAAMKELVGRLGGCEDPAEGALGE
jgi:hypothetical protein